MRPVLQTGAREATGLSGESQISVGGWRRDKRLARGRVWGHAAVTLVCTAVLWAPALSASETLVAPNGDSVLADSSPHLPAGSSPVGPVHRRSDGQIELIAPTAKNTTSAELCAPNTLCVGQGKTYTTLGAALAVAHEHNVIEVAGGTYRESAAVTVPNLTIRGVEGQPHFDCAGVKLEGDKACLLLAADGSTLENLDISGAQIANDAGGNGACVRNEPSISFTLRRIVCHASQTGVLSQGGTILIENSEFFDNGWSGTAHNVTFGGACIVTVRGSTFRDTRIGHEFKSRCAKTTIVDSTFRSTKGSRDLDIADGGETSVYRSVLIKVPGTGNPDLIGFASESCTHPGDMLVKEVRIVNSDPEARIHNYDKCAGHAITLEAVTFEGIPPKELGYVRDGTEISTVTPPSAGTAPVVPLAQP